MHQRLIVVSSHDNSSGDITPSDVSHAVYETLEEEGFNKQGGRWCHGPSDWFVIGGRWSGELTKIDKGISWDDMRNHLKSVLTEEESKNWNDNFINSQHIDGHKAELNSWWQEKTNTKSNHPWTRSSYDNSHEDDSQVLTKEMWEHFNTGFEYQSEEDFIVLYRWEKGEIDYDSDTVWQDLEGKWDNTDPDDFLEDEKKADKKDEVWLTVVDYHN